MTGVILRCCFIEELAPKKTMKTNEDIKVAVAEELRWEPLLHADTVTVALRGRELTLSGSVDAYRKKIAAEQAAGRVKGIKKLVNEIQVALPAKDRRSDAVLARDICDTLAWHTSVPANSITVEVADSCVYLNGVVASPGQAEAAFNAIAHLPGIRHIENRITCCAQQAG